MNSTLLTGIGELTTHEDERPVRTSAAIVIDEGLVAWVGDAAAAPAADSAVDLDGTVYRGDGLVPGADAVIGAIRAAGRRVVFLSNKPLQTRAEYAAKLTRLGVPAAPDDVINSSLVLARYLRDRDPGAPVFVIGEPPMRQEMADHGFEVRMDERVRWVVIAFDRTFDYAKLNVALQAVKGGVHCADVNGPSRLFFNLFLYGYAVRLVLEYAGGEQHNFFEFTEVGTLHFIQ